MKGMYHEALDAFNQAISLQSNDSMIFFGLGVAYEELKSYHEASIAYIKSIEIEPNFERTHHNLARVYYRGGMFQDSIAACRQAIKLKPDYSDAYFGLGLSLLKVGEKGEAIKTYHILKGLSC